MVDLNQAYLSANQLLKMHGRQAKSVADAMRQQYSREGDMESARIWLMIGYAVDDLQYDLQKPSPTQPSFTLHHSTSSAA